MNREQTNSIQALQKKKKKLGKENIWYKNHNTNLLDFAAYNTRWEPKLNGGWSPQFYSEVQVCISMTNWSK